MKVMSELADKTEKFIQSKEGGVVKVKVQDELVKSPALSDSQAVEIAQLLVSLEEEMTKPQDFEWAMENGTRITHYTFTNSLMKEKSVGHSCMGCF